MLTVFARGVTVCVVLFLPLLAGAQSATWPPSGQFVPLVGIPGVPTGTTNINAYVNALFLLAISLAALLSVIKIIIAGVKYMLSDVVTDKSKAKSDIWGALTGLLVIVSSVLILTTINPNLANFKILEGARPVPLQSWGGVQTQQPRTAQQVAPIINQSGQVVSPEQIANNPSAIIGTTMSLNWSQFPTDPATQRPLLDSNGQRQIESQLETYRQLCISNGSRGLQPAPNATQIPYSFRVTANRTNTGPTVYYSQYQCAQP